MAKVSNKIKVKNADGTFEDIQISYIGPNGTWSEGSGEATGNYSHAEGYNTTASGQGSHAEGVNTIASGANQHVQGKYNINDVDAEGNALNTYAHIVGNGTSNSARSNAHTLDWDGNAWFAGNLYSGEFKVVTEEDLIDLDIPTTGVLEGIHDEIKALKSTDTDFETMIEELQELNTNRETEIDNIESDISLIRKEIENKADENHNHDGDYDSAGAAANAYQNAQNYTLTRIEAAIEGKVKALDEETLVSARSYTNTKLASYLPLSGGTITGQVTFETSPVAKYNAFYNAKDSAGDTACLIGTGSAGIYLGSSSYPTSQKTVVVAADHTFRPVSDSSQELGTSGKRWSTIYSKNALNTSSDFNLKENIEEIPQKYIDMLDDISPVIFKFKQGDRLHGGYISQWVEEAMNKHGITAEEFGGFCKDQKVDENQNPIEGEYQYSLRYTEFIPILHAKIKQLEKEIYELKNK